MGLQTDLKMSVAQFSWTATAFFIGYCVAEILQGMSVSLVSSRGLQLLTAPLHRHAPATISCLKGPGSKRLLLGHLAVLHLGLPQHEIPH